MSQKKIYRCQQCGYETNVYEGRGFMGQQIVNMSCPDCKRIVPLVVGGVIGDTAPSFNSIVDMECDDYVGTMEDPIFGVGELEASIPGFDWLQGHSGELLTDEQSALLENLWNKRGLEESIAKDKLFPSSNNPLKTDRS